MSSAIPSPVAVRRHARHLLAVVAAAIALLALIAPPASAATWHWPLRGDVITPYRNSDDPYAAGQHRGIDIAGAVGDPVVAATDGEVTFAGTAGSSGLTVSVRTATGAHDTSYLHLSSIAVRKGDRVGAGQSLGAVGTTGTRSAERPHLHFGVRLAGSPHAYVDPLGLLPTTPATPIPEAPSTAPVPIVSPVKAPQLAPDPVDAPRPAPVPHRVPAARRVPATGRVPTGDRVPARRRAPAARRAPALHRTPLIERVRADGRAPTRAPAPLDAHAADPAPLDRDPAKAAPATRGRHAARRLATPTPGTRHPLAALHSPTSVSPPTPRAHAPNPGQPGKTTAGETHAERTAPTGGPNAGWALACLGLLVAAALLGTGKGRDGRATSPRARLAALLRPLTGRG